MSEGDWAFPDALQPGADDVSFDLDDALNAVVMLRAEVPDDAFTASALGTERIGNGVVIDDDGLVVTIGYLIAEASSIWLTTNSGRTVSAYALAYDHITGFGLVRAVEPLDATMLKRGTADACHQGDQVFVISQGGAAHALKAKLIDKREFAGYWEYLLDEALFTAPAHPQWGGAALVGQDGRLAGVGSLLVQEVIGGEQVQGNMLVPIDLLNDTLEHLLATGRSPAQPRPWIGMSTVESDRRLVVSGASRHGPAAKAGMQPGDVVLEVDGSRVSTLAQMLSAIWNLGRPGVTVPLTIARSGQVMQCKIQSADRKDFLKKPVLH
ncbi:MAG: S1C family serine protease [Gammaproteobacteria bacterium]|nr:S1C family serine protease [Gammaproteobacteria bacterium]